MAMSFTSLARVKGFTSQVSPLSLSPILHAEIPLLSLDMVGASSALLVTTRDFGHSTATLDGTWLLGL